MQPHGAPATAPLQGEEVAPEGDAETHCHLDSVPLVPPSAAFPASTKLGQPLGGMHASAAPPWFPGLGGDMGLGEPLFGANWVKPEMLDSMQDSLLRPPAA